MLMWLLAAMAILMGVAVQQVSFQMRREKEAELIFRGEQYVEAIRLYTKRFGRNPMQLKEIWEAKPRVIRKKWKDPMTGSEIWGVVFAGQQGKPNRRRGPTPTPTPAAGKPGQDRPQIGPIIGVHSTSCDESIRTYQGHDTYCKWLFVYKPEPDQRRKPRPTPPPKP